MPKTTPKKETVRQMLASGRRLDAGRVADVVARIGRHPARIAQLIPCLWDDDPAIANRAADALERITRTHRERAQRWKLPLLGLMAEARPSDLDKKLRWNLALIVPRLKLTLPECRRAAALLRSWLDDPNSISSSIVKTAALHGLADLARRDPSSLPATVELLQIAGRSGTPAMRARSRILLQELQVEKLEIRRPQRPKRTSIHMFD